jgi:sulfoxide reductase catalytic subunit YedY
LRNSITTNSGDGAIIIQQKPDIKPSQITPQSVYQNRRKFLKTTAALAIGGSLPLLSLGSREAAAATKFENLIKSPFSTDAELTDYEDVTSYNNFYEFGTDKRSPSKEAYRLTTRPGVCQYPVNARHPGTGILRIFSKRFLQKSGYTATDVWKPGQWWYLGWDFLSVIS